MNYYPNEIEGFDSSTTKNNMLKNLNEDLDILKCSKNNLSKTCPVLLCNYEKHNLENSKIFDRNTSKDADLPIKPMRGGFTRCHQYIDLDATNADLHLNLNKQIPTNQNIKNKYIPGKGSGIDFLKNIDIDSELKNLDIDNSKCPSDKFAPDSECINRNFNNPRLLKKPYCQNYKKYKYKNNSKPYKTICGNNLLNVEGLYDNENENYNSLKCNSLVKFNYTDCDYPSNNTPGNCSSYKLVNQCDNVSNWNNHPLLNDPNYSTRSNNTGVGPHRSNHNCENIWNNITKRQYLNY